MTAPYFSISYMLASFSEQLTVKTVSIWTYHIFIKYKSAVYCPKPLDYPLY